jgi:hypothetical protein
MSSCASCGAQLGVGRFCTNCGAPVDSSPEGAPVMASDADDWRTNTAERKVPVPAADPRTPPTAVAPPPPPRYPLYADEVEHYSAYGPLVTAPEPVPEAVPADPEPAAEEYEYDYDEERRSPVLWILAAALVLVLVGAGWWFLVRDHDSGHAADRGTGGSASGSPTAEQDGVDVASRASAKAPKTAKPNQDVNGDQVSYDASNMLDGVPETAWRVAGSARGMTLTFTLRDPTELHRVGLINGYAKESTDPKGRSFDWYHGNRRIEVVLWTFDDGTKVRQELTDSRKLQLTDVDDVVTSKVLLKIVKVSKPGTGTAARDFTAISEVSLVGEPS